MSSNIDFQRWVLRWAPTPNDSYEWRNLFLGIHEVGESNVVDDEGRIARSLSLYCIDFDCVFMQRMVELSADCESGMLKLNGRHCKPEGYIRAWRKAYECPVDLSDYLDYSNLSLTLRCLRSAYYEDVRRISNPALRDTKTQEYQEFVSLLEETEGVEELRDERYDDVYRYTRLTITADNAETMRQIVSTALRNGMDGRQCARTNFTTYAYERASRNAHLALAE
ncbi:hypothetical protein A3709_19395 [Halioglobus sp. HI00S01]|uniref:hypothetical protein n=1 Tax=Halioglobus sp. HI00S01 TaxID=1822214 RepID=UPI0007C23619|nr:hypothetical protein [Halioglobus sp. HI00S01]KZX57790.1 hypothetical protein A3709_19395 [Halioglobus sp. HI00S01]